MLLVVIASCRHVASCSPIASCRLLRRVALSPFMRLLVGGAVVRRRCVASSPPHLTCLVVAVSCVYYIIVLLSLPIAPLLLVGCCVCPLSRSPLQFLALRRVVSPHAWHRCRLASPVALLRYIALTCHIVAVSRVAYCPLAVSPSPSLALRRFVYLPRLFVGRAVVVALCCPRLASPVLLCHLSCVCTRSISIVMTHRRRDGKSIRRRVGTPGSYRHQSLPPAPARWRKCDGDASTTTTCRDGASLNTASCD